MLEPPIPKDEVKRLQALYKYSILDTEAEASFDDLAKMVSYICQTPMALISLVDKNRQWFKANIGLGGQQTSRKVSFCAHALAQKDTLLVIPDTLKDERFYDNPLVTDTPGIRFYAGAPLITPEGYAIGTLCAIDHVPRNLDSQQLKALKTLGQQVVAQLELKRQLNLLQESQAQMLQTGKMAALGELASSIAHEINNPNSFIYGNLGYLSEHIQNLLNLIDLYQAHCSMRSPVCKEFSEKIELPFIRKDIPDILSSIKRGSERIQRIVRSLRTFDSSDVQGFKLIDIHQIIENTIEHFASKMRNSKRYRDILIIRNYKDIPLVEGQLASINQVLFHLLDNAIDALEDSPASQRSVEIRTENLDHRSISIKIIDNGAGISEAIQSRIFDPFFTTKAISKATGTGLFVCRQVVSEQHGGRLRFVSAPNAGTAFSIELPIRQAWRFDQCAESEAGQLAAS